MRYYLVIPAGGSGRRFAAAVPKQYAALGSSTVIEHALATFEADTDCAGIVVAVAPDDSWWPAIAARRTRLIETAPGGEHRAHSVRNALRVLVGRAEIVAATPDGHAASEDPHLREEVGPLRGEIAALSQRIVGLEGALTKTRDRLVELEGRSSVSNDTGALDDDEQRRAVRTAKSCGRARFGLPGATELGRRGTRRLRRCA